MILADAATTLNALAAVLGAAAVLAATFVNAYRAKAKAEHADRKADTTRTIVNEMGKRTDDVARSTGGFGIMAAQVTGISTEMVAMTSRHAEHERTMAEALARSDARHIACEQRELKLQERVESLQDSLGRIQKAVASMHPELVDRGE